MHKNSVPVSQKTHYIPITNICQLNAVWSNICCLLWESNRIYNYTNSMEQSPSSAVNSPQLDNKLPIFYVMFITTFKACHLSFSWARSTQSIPHHLTFFRSILILSSHLCIGLPSGLFPSGFPTKTLHVPLLFPICTTCLVHVILIYLITWVIFGEEYRS